jgi:hypothetical protein
MDVEVLRLVGQAASAGGDDLGTAWRVAFAHQVRAPRGPQHLVTGIPMEGQPAPWRATRAGLAIHGSRGHPWGVTPEMARWPQRWPRAQGWPSLGAVAISGAQPALMHACKGRDAGPAGKQGEGPHPGHCGGRERITRRRARVPKSLSTKGLGQSIRASIELLTCHELRAIDRTFKIISDRGVPPVLPPVLRWEPPDRATHSFGFFVRF